MVLSSQISDRTPLTGFVIGVTADRRSEEQIKLLTGRGAECVHGPTIQTHPLGSESELREATTELINDPPKTVVMTTGLGVRGWLEAADALHMGDKLLAALAEAEILARGPKATGALVTAGLDVAWIAPNAQYDDVIDELASRDTPDKRCAVQLDGAGADGLCDRLEEIGWDVLRVPVYKWSLPQDHSAAQRLIRAAIERRLDAVTFTARPAVDNLFEIATLTDDHDELLDAFRGDVTPVCVGPVCATGFADSGPNAIIPLVPERYRLGAMVQTISTDFTARSREVDLAGVTVRIQGRCVTVDGEELMLSDRERAVLDVLTERPGVVVSKRELLRRAWRGTESDEHLAEVTVGRLRRRLGSAGTGIETVIRRGYRASPT